MPACCGGRARHGVGRERDDIHNTRNQRKAAPAPDDPRVQPPSAPAGTSPKHNPSLRSRGFSRRGPLISRPNTLDSPSCWVTFDASSKGRALRRDGGRFRSERYEKQAPILVGRRRYFGELMPTYWYKTSCFQRFAQVFRKWGPCRTTGAFSMTEKTELVSRLVEARSRFYSASGSARYVSCGTPRETVVLLVSLAPVPSNTSDSLTFPGVAWDLVDRAALFSSRNNPGPTFARSPC